VRRTHLCLLDEMARHAKLSATELNRLRANLAAGGVTQHKTFVSGKRKTVCATSIAAYFGIAHQDYRVCFRINDLKRILNRRGWSVASRQSKFCRKSCTVSHLMKQIAGQSSHEVGEYLVHVSGHVLILGRNGEVAVDTDPRKSDRRKVMKVYIVKKGRGL